MFKEFKAFLMRGNVVDLAVAVVIGAAFAAVVTRSSTTSSRRSSASPVDRLLHLALHDQRQRVPLRRLHQRVISFVSIAAAIFFFVVKPLNMIMARIRKPEELGPDAPTETGLLIEILDLLAKRPL